MRVRAWVALLLATLLVAGCSGGGADPRDDVTESPSASEDDDLPVGQQVEAMVTVDVSGAANFHWQDQEPVSFNRLGSPAGQVNLLQGGFLYVISLPDRPTDRFRWGFDLMGVYDDKPGTFTMPATVGGAAQGQASSGVLFNFLRVKDPSVGDATKDDLVFFKQFNQLVQPCTLTVSAGHATGVLDCPELASPEGETIALRVEWRPTA